MKPKIVLYFLILFISVSCSKNNISETIDLKSNWHFSPDKKNTGISEAWFSPDFDDSKWEIIQAGQRWEDQGFPDLDGLAWYRRTIQIPEDWKGNDVWIKFGGVNDAYTLYINGEEICSYGDSNYSFAAKPSFFKISDKIKYGALNWIAIRVNDWGNSGGLWHLPVIITTDKKETDLYKPISDSVFDPVKSGYKLYWEDNFDGEVLNTAKWKHRALGLRRDGIGTEEAVEVKGGFLSIRAYMENDTLRVGAISTEGIKGFKYGYFVCRAKLPKTTGPWAAFWIQSSKISAGEDPGKYGMEIDIFEYFRDQGGDFISHNLHWAYGPNQKTSGAFLSKVPGIDQGFHTFALEWTPEKYTFIIDGMKYYEFTKAISHIEESIILSFESCFKENLRNASLPDEFVVDYVRVYQKKYLK